MTITSETIFSSNRAIDEAIKELLPLFSIESQSKMKRAILHAKIAAEKYKNENTDANARHIFREFIPACYLNKNGFNFEYKKHIQGKTPDWVDISERLLLESYTFERGGSSTYVNRINSSAIKKCNKYKPIIEANSFRFILVIYLDFLTCITLDECRENRELFRPSFYNNITLWAIVFFTEAAILNNRQQYNFLSLCANSTFKAIPHWPFETISLTS
jgi:hypothetical protein